MQTRPVVSEHTRQAGDDYGTDIDDTTGAFLLIDPFQMVYESGIFVLSSYSGPLRCFF